MLSTGTPITFHVLKGEESQMCFTFFLYGRMIAAIDVTRSVDTTCMPPATRPVRTSVNRYQYATTRKTEIAKTKRYMPTGEAQRALTAVNHLGPIRSMPHAKKAR